MLTYDDVLIEPGFSEINSRKDVSITSFGLDVPVISANMDSVTEDAMATEMRKAGGIGAIHRFMDINRNLSIYRNSPPDTYCSVGLGDYEMQRFKALVGFGANNFILDVAHGAQQQVVDQAKMYLSYKKVNLIVGNFASAVGIEEFMRRVFPFQIQAYKVGIGPGAACTTRIKTGVGVPQLSAIQECSRFVPVIADGGIKTSGDIAKALAAGASAVMVGRMFAGTPASSGRSVRSADKWVKVYRGSASQSSYNDQGKIADWITDEGDSGIVPVNGTVENIMKDIAGGLRSALTYVGAKDIVEFRDKAVFIKVTPNAIKENGSRL